MMAAMLAFAGTAMAQEVTPIIASDFAIPSGSAANLEIMMNFPTEETVCGYNFSLYLPEGIEPGRSTLEASVTIPTNVETVYPEIKYMEYDEELDEEVEKTAKPKDQLKIEKKTDGGILFVWIDQNYGKTPLKSTKGLIMRINLKGDAQGTAKIANQGITNIDNVSLGMKDGVNTFGECEFGINQETVGINEIQSTDSDAPAYNLQGIRVNNAKGLIIRDGKKMIVK